MIRDVEDRKRPRDKALTAAEEEVRAARASVRMLYFVVALAILNVLIQGLRLYFSLTAP